MLVGLPTLDQGSGFTVDGYERNMRGSTSKITIIPYSHYYWVGGPPKVYGRFEWAVEDWSEGRRGI